MMRRLLTLLALLALSALALAACGDDESTDDASASAGASERAGDAFPVAVDQKLGQVTIEREPKRVVALDFPSADAALALGVNPVAIQKLTYLEDGIQEWTKRALGGQSVELIDQDNGFPLERIAALEPDVILATHTYPLISESWDELNRIAPVVGHVGEPDTDTWQQGVRQVAKALGRSDQGEQVIADIEGQMADARKRYPELSGKHVSIFNYTPQGLYVINENDDFSIRFLRELGFAGVPPTVARLEGQDKRAQISPERYKLVDADVLLGTSPDPKLLDQLGRDTLFRRVPAVARGAFVPLDIGDGTSMAFPSALSVPFAVERLAPRIAAAVRRR